MIEFALFYFVLLAIIIALIFVLLLYTGYHTRTLAPSLLGSNYGVANVTDAFVVMAINDGETGAGTTPTEEAINFGAAGGHAIEVEFIPLNDDRTRKLNGSITLLMTTAVAEGSPITLNITDNGNTVCDDSRFYIYNSSRGLTTVRLQFEAPALDADQIHTLQVQIKANPDIPVNQLQVNSIYVSYY